MTGSRAPEKIETDLLSPLTVFGKESLRKRYLLITHLLESSINNFSAFLLLPILDYIECSQVGFLYQSVKSYREKKITGARLAEVIFESFLISDSRVAFVTDDFSPIERASLINDPDFPNILKLYYFKASDLPEEIARDSQLANALLFGLLKALELQTIEEMQQDVLPMCDYVRGIIISNATSKDKSKEPDIKILDNACDHYNELCEGAPSALIHNVLLSYFAEHPEIFKFLINMRTEVPHLRLPNADLKAFDFSWYCLCGADLRGVTFSKNLEYLKLDYADIRDAKIKLSANMSLREAFFNTIEPGVIESLDCLGAHIGKDAAYQLRSSYMCPLKKEDPFYLVQNYFNEKYSVKLQKLRMPRIESRVIRNQTVSIFCDPPPIPESALPSLELAIFFRGITTARTEELFDQFIEVFQHHYPGVLENCVQEDINFWDILTQARDRLQEIDKKEKEEKANAFCPDRFFSLPTVLSVQTSNSNTTQERKISIM